MIIKNYEIKEFGEFLYEMKLKGRSSIMRSRLIKLLEERLTLINDERQQLINEYAKKDDNDQPLTEEHEGKSAYVIGDPEEYSHEVAMLMTEDFIIEETQERMTMLTTVRDIIFEYDEELSGDAAMQYDRWYEIVEEIE